jgi:hypothetical protein
MEIFVTPRGRTSWVPVFREEFFGGVGVNPEVFDSADDFEGGVVASVAFEGEGALGQEITCSLRSTGGVHVWHSEGKRGSCAGGGGSTGIGEPLGGGFEHPSLGGIGALVNSTSGSDNVASPAADIKTSGEYIRALAHRCVTTIIEVPSASWCVDHVGIGQRPSLKFKPQQFLVSMLVSFVVYVDDEQRLVLAVAGGGNADVGVGMPEPPLLNLLVIGGGLIRKI